MSSKLVVFCIPVSGTGHLNASIGLCLALQRNGHRIVFGAEKKWKGNFLKYGFEEQIYEEREKQQDEKPLQFVVEELERQKPLLKLPPDQQSPRFRKMFDFFTNRAKYCNQRVEEIIQEVKPDVIIQDNYVAVPAIIKSNVPFVLLYSCGPLFALQSDLLPPCGFGLPLDDQSDWERCRHLRKNALVDTFEEFNKWVISCGAPALPENRFQYESSDLNILLYPKAAFEDYAKLAKVGNNWMLVEHAIREVDQEFELPESFKRQPGKTVYFSLGSMISADVELMHQLLSILAKSPHKFIVSKGLQHEKVTLADNMYGESFLPQLKVLPLCDLFITHGGNNSFTEALYFGVPMIVLPVLTDQYDNAQRVVEMQIGARLSTYSVGEDELLSTIESIVSDEKMYKKVKLISDQIKSSTSLTDVTRRIEQIAASRRSQ